MTFTYVVTVEIEAEPPTVQEAMYIAGQLAGLIHRGSSRLIAANLPLQAGKIEIAIRPVTAIPPPHENPDPEAERPAL